MTILRDLVARVSFKTDTTDLERLNDRMGMVKRSIAGIATTALSGWAIKTGGDLDFLQQQLNVGFGGRLDEVKNKISELTSVDAFGNESIFSEKEVTQAAINLDRLGFSAEDVVLRLQQASTLLTRARTTSISEVSQRFGAALQKGGISELFREFRLIDIKTAEELRILENQIGSSSGVLHERATREYRKRIADVIDQNKKVLESERDALTISTTGTNLRVGAQMQNLWQEIARIITTVMKPALDGISKIIAGIESSVEKVRVAMDEAGGASEAFFRTLKNLWPEHNEDIEGAQKAWKGLTDFVGSLFDTVPGATLSIGGIAMFLLTKNPLWVVGGILGGSMLSNIMADWNVTEKFLKTPLLTRIAGATIGGIMMFLLTRNPIWIFAGAKTGEFVGGEVGDFLGGGVLGNKSPLGRLFFGNENDPNNPGGILGKRPQELSTPPASGRPQERELKQTPIPGLSQLGGQQVSPISVGSVSIIVQGAGNNAMEIARMVKKEFSDQVMRVAMEFGPLQEGNS